MKLLCTIFVGLLLLGLSGCFAPGCVLTGQDQDELSFYRVQYSLHKINEKEYITLLQTKIETIQTRPVCIEDLQWGPSNDF